MGTTYNISAWGAISIDQNTLQKKVDSKLQKINSIASTWDSNSQISRFNRTDSTSPSKVDPFFIKMINTAKNITVKSDGAFDITIAPLIDLWGFDAKGRVTKAPSIKKRTDVLNQIGTKYIHTDTQNLTVQKDRSAITINLSAIAKGGGVDEIARLLEGLGFKNYLVEIGGEIYARGTNQNHKIWRVGIETPNSTGNTISRVISIDKMGLATSGDYRNYFEENNIRYSHILNPKTGMPIRHKLASVSVLAPTSAQADGWATAMMVLGEKDGMAIAKKHNIAIFMLVRDGNTFKSLSSAAWQDIIKQ